MLTHSPANRPKRTCFFFYGCPTALCECSNSALGVTPLHTDGGDQTESSVPKWVFYCTELVNGLSDLSTRAGVLTLLL